MSKIIASAHIVRPISEPTDFYFELNQAIQSMQMDNLEVEAQYSSTSDYFSVMLLGRQTEIHAIEERKKKKEFKLDQDIE